MAPFGHSKKVISALGQWHEGESHQTTDGFRISYFASLYRCTCPGWTTDTYSPLQRRSCQHLRKLHGSIAEASRTENICDYSLLEDTQFGECEGAIESDWFQYLNPTISCPLEVEVQLCAKHMSNRAYALVEDGVMKLAASKYH